MEKKKWQGIVLWDSYIPVKMVSFNLWLLLPLWTEQCSLVWFCTKGRNTVGSLSQSPLVLTSACWSRPSEAEFLWQQQELGLFGVYPMHVQYILLHLIWTFLHLTDPRCSWRCLLPVGLTLLVIQNREVKGQIKAEWKTAEKQSAIGGRYHYMFHRNRPVRGVYDLQLKLNFLNHVKNLKNDRV